MNRASRSLRQVASVLIAFVATVVCPATSAMKCSYTDDNGKLKTFPDARSACIAKLQDQNPPEVFKSAVVNPETKDVHCTAQTIPYQGTFDMHQSGITCDGGVPVGEGDPSSGNGSNRPDRSSNPNDRCPSVPAKTKDGGAIAKIDELAMVRMPEHHSECFDTSKYGSDKGKLKELAAQLRRQQIGINDMTLDEFIGGMNWYASARQEGPKATRKGEGKKQEAVRDTYREKMGASMRRSMQCSGQSAAQIEATVEEKVAKELATLHALHEPDINVGGKDVTRLGDRTVNMDIGNQWVAAPQGHPDDSRRFRLLAAVMEAQTKVGPGAKLNVVLEPCRH